MTGCGLNDRTVRGIIRDLSDGYGAEDINVRGTATTEQVWYVVSFMRKHEMLDRFFSDNRKKRKKNA